MAIVKGLNLEAIRTLGKIVTFAAHKGQTIARIRMRDRGPATSPALIIWQQRFASACAAAKTLDISVVDAYRELTADTDWTWKDLFTSHYLTYWRDNNAPPLVITKLIFSWGSPIAQLTFAVAPWSWPEPFGYGIDGYGILPYGTPPELAGAENIPQAAYYQFAYSDLLPKPYETFHSSPPTNPGCTKPAARGPLTFFQPTTFTPLPVSVPINWTLRINHFGTETNQGSCILTADAAWGVYTSDPIIRHNQPFQIGLTAASFIGTGLPVIYRGFWGDLELDLEDAAIPEHWWPFVDTISFIPNWTETDPQGPWVIQASFGAGQTTIIPGFSPITIRPPLQYSAQIPMIFRQVAIQPEYPCPQGTNHTWNFTFPTHATVTFKPILDQTFNSDDNPPDLPFALNLETSEGTIPVVSPPLQITLGP